MSVTTYTALGSLIEKSKGLVVTTYTSAEDFVDDLTAQLPTGDNVIHVTRIAYGGAAGGIALNIEAIASLSTRINVPIRIVNDNVPQTAGMRDGDVLTVRAHVTGGVGSEVYTYFVIENGESATLVQSAAGSWYMLNSILPAVNAALSGDYA